MPLAYRIDTRQHPRRRRVDALQTPSLSVECIHMRQVSVRALRGVTPFAVAGATFPRAPPCTQWPVDLYCPKITQERGRTAVLSDDTGAIRAEEAARGCGGPS